jgi:dienelactone hydrolase
MIMAGFRVARRFLLLVVLSLTVTILPVSGQVRAPQRQTGFLTRVYKDESGSHKYAFFIPHNYTPSKKWPVILFLHGASERGNDGVLPTTYGLGPIIWQREANFPFIAVFPQCEDMQGRLLKGWSPDSADSRRALKILEQVEKDYSVDKKREILTGWSMGGYGAWEWAAADPQRWLSVVPIAGGGDPASAAKLKDVPIWAWHGAKDRSVRPEQSRKMIEAARAAGGEPRYTEVADGDHNVWMQVYEDDSLYAWMLTPHGDPAKLPAVTTQPRTAGDKPIPLPEAAFIPALDIPHAAYARLGNEMLAALADALPKVVSPTMLTGRLGDISDSTEAQGYSFSVYMSGLSYRGQLARANVKAYHKDRLNIQLGLSNVVVTIGGTSLSGQRHSAQAGPINVVIGHQRPVWLSFDVTPYVENRKLRFRHVGTSFNIPSDNFYVTAPGGVSTQGFGMTEAKVSNGLVSGLYGRRAMMEQKVAAVVPNLIAELEKQFDIASAGKAITGVWPLPVYQPRFKIWPAEVSTDENGVSLVLGVTAAAVDPAKPPKSVRSVAPVGPGLAAVPQSTKLQIGLAAQMLAPLSELLVEADVARINLADAPAPIMAKLGDPAVLAEAIPDLKRFGEQLQLQTELVLTGPITVSDSSSKSPRLEANQLRILVAIKTDPASAAWKPYAEFEMTLRQSFTPALARPTELTRAVSVTPDAAAEINVKGKFVGAFEAQQATIDTDRLKSLFAAGWDDYLTGGGPSEASLPDIDLGYTMLRAQDAGWKAPELYAIFDAPRVKITNTSDKTLVYETKGPYSNWGGPFTLKPGAVHDFPIAYPLVFRRRAGNAYQMFTLPVGTHSEFRTKVPGTPEMLYKAREPDVVEKAVSEVASAASDKK